MWSLALLHETVTLWKECVQRVIAQLSSILNMAEQLEALKRGKVGVLSQHGSHVTTLLEAKLVQSMERALGHIMEEKKILRVVVQRLKKCVNESQAAFEKSVKTKGLEWTCKRTAHEFSLADHTHWARQLHSAYKAELEEKSSSLQGLRYDSTTLSHILSVWEKTPQQIQETLQCLHYTMERL